MKWSKVNTNKCDLVHVPPPIMMCHDLTSVNGPGNVQIPSDNNNNQNVNTPILIIKPAFALVEIRRPLRLKVFLVANNTEQEINSGLNFESSNNTVASVTNSGVVFGIKEGIVVITATWNNMMAAAQIEVIESCISAKANIFLLIDRSPSMSQPFDDSLTKLDYAKLIAIRIASEINYAKDTLWIGMYPKSENANRFGFLPAQFNNKDVAIEEIRKIGIVQCDYTNVANALAHAVAFAKDNSNIRDIKLVIHISDGWYYYPPLEYAEHSQPWKVPEEEMRYIKHTVEEIKVAEAIVMNIGVRAMKRGYRFMLLTSTPGFFLNAGPNNNGQQIMEIASGLKGYLCTGNCKGNETITLNYGQLDYKNFAKFTVAHGNVDLLGNGYYDILPGNGLYVGIRSLKNPQYPLRYLDTWTPSNHPTPLSAPNQSPIKYESVNSSIGKMVDGIKIKAYLYYFDTRNNIKISELNAGRPSRFNVYGVDRNGQYHLIKTFNLECFTGDLEEYIGLSNNYIFRLDNYNFYPKYVIAFNATCENLNNVLLHSVEFYETDPEQIFYDDPNQTILRSNQFFVPLNPTIKVTAVMAGNQIDLPPGTIPSEINSGFVKFKLISNATGYLMVTSFNVPFKSKFDTYTWDIAPAPPGSQFQIGNEDCHLEIECRFRRQLVYLKSVKIEINGQLVFDSNFDAENLVTIEGECTPEVTLYKPVECAGRGCLDVPPDVQVEDLTAENPIE